MTRTSKRMLRLTLAAAAGFAVLLATDKMPPTHPDILVTTADARIGRPLTPLSYAGVARRTARRGAYAAGAAAAGAAAAGAYYGSGCYQAVDTYGRVYTRCP
jgi:cytochrome c-type biogenesis protein CcmH/NrfG